MNDRAPTTVQLPTRPYLGLDYFREEDAALFSERDKELHDCAAMLLNMNVKIFVLQGSTGAGKSSFLRAGLIPRLRQNGNGRAHFLSDGDCVIRCTADPLIWLFKSISNAVVSGRLGAFTLPPTWPSVEVARSSKDLADAMLSALQLLCRQLAGHLILVLDQAEEVLTQAQDGTGLDEQGKAFFYFLEEVYLQNIDVRIVVALRTEYYGRFRDELRIEDDRLALRPYSGGIEPYLLRPLRDPAKLVRIVQAPTLISDGTLFNFRFHTDAAEKIVADLLKYFPHGSVTPFLQVICAILYEGLTPEKRDIAVADYVALNDVEGIARLYLDRGVSQVLGAHASKRQKNTWLLLLHGLTSTQGGGTVVSNILPLSVLESDARKLGIDGDVAGALEKLCDGPSPLLRGIPRDRPTQFSLKHDVLAVVFTRWKLKFSIMAAEAVERKKRTLKFMGISGLTITLIAAAVCGMLWEKVRFDALDAATEAKMQEALMPPRSDFRQSLETAVTTFDKLGHEHYIFPNKLADLKLRVARQLRSIVLRSPRFSGEFWSADFDPVTRRVLALQTDRTGVLDLSLDSQSASRDRFPERRLALPLSAGAGLPKETPAAGFISGMGPAVFINRRLYYWDQSSRLQRPVNLEVSLTKGGSESQWSRYEIHNGALYLIDYFASGKDIDIFGTVLYKGEIERFGHGLEPTLRVPAKHEVQRQKFTTNLKNFPPPFYSTASTSVGSYAYFYPVDRTSSMSALQWLIHPAGGESFIIPGAQAAGSAPDYNMRLGFVAGANAVVLQRSAGQFEYLPLMRPALPNGAAAPPAVGLSTSNAPTPLQFDRGDGPDGAGLAPAAPNNTWAHAPLAAVNTQGNLKVAWITPGGIATAAGRLGTRLKNSDGPGNANLLLTGEQTGTKLQFSEDAELLYMQQEATVSNPVSIHVWDLSKARAQYVNALPDQKLLSLACGILKHSVPPATPQQAYNVRPAALAPVACRPGQPLSKK